MDRSGVQQHLKLYSEDSLSLGIIDTFTDLVEAFN